MEKKYMFVCPKCLETYSSDSVSVAQYCKNCRSELIRMSISVTDWRQLNDEQKQLYIESELNRIDRNQINKRRNAWEEVVAFLGYAAFYFFLGGIHLARDSELPWVLIGMAISFAVFWWKRPSINEWKENCIDRKWFYLVGGVLFGIMGYIEPARVTHEFGKYTVTYNNLPQKLYYIFLSVVLLTKGFYSIHLINSQIIRDEENKSSYETSSPENIIISSSNNYTDLHSELNSYSDSVIARSADLKQEKEDIELEKDSSAIKEMDVEDGPPVLVQEKAINSYGVTENASDQKKPSDQARNSIDTKPVFYGSSTVRFCRKCGTRLDDGVAYCRKCGTRINQENE